jgi:broad specificity phosphatase PhoE
VRHPLDLGSAGAIDLRLAGRSAIFMVVAKLILVKHAAPQIAPDVPSPRWVLSAEGRRRCDWLASQLREQGVRRLYSSLEPKALETAALVAVQLGLAVRPRQDLHENDRMGLGFVSADEMRRRIRRFFEAPSAVAMGAETADAAASRFEGAIRALVSEAPEEAAAVVTHGTVLTTLIARYDRLDAFAFWASLSLPACVVMDGASFRLEGPVLNYPG